MENKVRIPGTEVTFVRPGNKPDEVCPVYTNNEKEPQPRKIGRFVIVRHKKWTFGFVRPKDDSWTYLVFKWGLALGKFTILRMKKDIPPKLQ